MRTLIHRAVAATAVALTLTGLTGCALLAPQAEPAVRDEDTGEIVESSEADVFSLQVGDCLSDTISEEQVELTSMPTVPCADPHSSEAYATTELPDGEFPGDAGVIESAESFCLDAFTGFVGLTYDESVLEVSSMYPTQDSWERLDDRKVLCLISSPDGDAPGTLEGAQR